MRYADDFVICARYIDDRMTHWLSGAMSRLGLTLNQEKTRVARLSPEGDTVDFLGFTIRLARSHFGGTFGVVTPSSRAVTRGMRKLSDLTNSRRSCVPSRVVVHQVNTFLRGWSGYFRHGYAGRALGKIDWHALQCLKRHMKRHSQRPCGPPKGVSWYQHLHERMGLIRVAAGRR